MIMKLQRRDRLARLYHAEQAETGDLKFIIGKMNKFFREMIVIDPLLWGGVKPKIEFASFNKASPSF